MLDLNDLKIAIENIVTMLKSLVTAEVLTADEARLIAPVIIKEIMRKSFIEAVYEV